MNIKLQGDDSNLIKTKNSVLAFLTKLFQYTRNVRRHKFYNFPNLSTLSFNNDDLLIYYQHLFDGSLFNCQHNKIIPEQLTTDQKIKIIFKNLQTLPWVRVGC